MSLFEGINQHDMGHFLLLYKFHDVIVYCAVAVLIDVHALDCVLSFKPAKLVLQIAVNVNVALMCVRFWCTRPNSSAEQKMAKRLP